MRRIKLLSWWIMALLCAIPLSALGQSYTYNVGDKITTSDGIYKVVGANLITNPSFDDGTTGWTDGTGSEMSSSYFTVVENGGADDGAYLKCTANAGSGKAQSVRTNWQLEAGKTYVISLWSVNSGKYSNIYLGKNATDTKTVITNVPNAGSWTQTSAVFSTTDEYVYCIANFAWLGSAGYDCFFLGEVEATNELATEALTNAIADAESVLANTEEGDEAGKFKSETRATLQSAIDAAKGVLSSATTQSEINEAVSTLNAAVSTYEESKNPPFVLGEKYVLINRASGLYLTNVGGTIKITDDAGELNQAFSFVAAPEGTAANRYNLVDGNGNYVYRSGSWDTKAGESTDLTANNALFTMVENGDYYQIKNFGSGSVLGVDGTSSGSAVYCNKNGTSYPKLDWTIQKFVAAADRDAEYTFQQTLSKANTQFNDIDEGMLGTNPFDYSKEAYDKLKSAIEHANAVSSDYENELAALNVALEEFDANKIVAPDASKSYNIINNAGQTLLSFNDGSAPCFGTENGGDEQKFTFVLNEDGSYSIKNVKNSQYVAKSSSSAWNMTWVEDNSATEAHWAITPYSADVKVIQNLAGKGYIGADATTAGSLTYCDKAASAASSQWLIEEATLTRTLDKAIAEAQSLYDNTAVGSEYYEVPQTAKDALLAAITKATADKAACATMDDVTAAVETLAAAVETFKTSFNEVQAFDAGTTYNIIHNGGKYLSTTTGKLALAEAATDDSDASAAQQYVLEPVEYTGADGNILAMTYNVKNVSTGKYIVRTGTYNTALSESNDTTAAVLQVVQIGGELGLKFVETDSYLGCDAGTVGSGVYSDKDAVNSSSARWIIKPAAAVVVFDKSKLKEALDSAKALKASMVWGNEVGQYYQADIDALGNEITKYNAIYVSSKDEAEVSTATAALLKVIEEYKAKAHTETQDMLKVAADVLEAAEAAYSEALKNVGDEKGQYRQATCDAFRKFIDDFKSAPTLEVMYTISSETSTFKSNTVKTDRTALKAAIADAESAYSDLTIGGYDGQTPAAAAAALDEAIKAAKTVYENAPTLTQTAVDGAVKTLNAAVKTCDDAVVVIVFASLDNATDSLATYVNGTTNVGEADRQCPTADLNAAKAALDKANAIDRGAVYQSVVDKFTAETREALTTFIAALKASSGLSELIATCDDVYENGNSAGASAVQRAKFRRAIENAKSVLASAAPTQSELATAYDELKSAYDSYVVVVGIEGTGVDSLVIKASDGVISVGGASENAVVSVYAMNGTKLYTAVVDGSVSVDVPAGNYIVKIVSGSASVTKKILVK